MYVRLEAWVLGPEPSTFAPDSRWSNKDMDPVPPKQVSSATTIFCDPRVDALQMFTESDCVLRQRTWTTTNYIAYWISDAFTVPVWELASSMLAIGLSW